MTLQRFAILNLAKGLSTTGFGSGAFLPTLVAPAYEGVRNFHVACDILTVIAIWSMELRRRRAAAVQQ